MADEEKCGGTSGWLRFGPVGLLGLAVLEAGLRAVTGGRLRVAVLGPAAPALLAALRAYWRRMHGGRGPGHGVESCQR